MYAQYLRFLPVAGLRFTFYALYPSPQLTCILLRSLTHPPAFDYHPPNVFSPEDAYFSDKLDKT